LRIQANPIPVLKCPSAPASANYVPNAIDYSVDTRFGFGTAASLAKNKLLAAPAKIRDRGIDGNNWSSVLAHFLVPASSPPNATTNWVDDYTQDPVRVRNVTDGMSNSIMIVECAGRPDLWEAGVYKPTDASGNPISVKGIGWADDQNWFVIHNVCGETQMMNCNNNNEIYSFHNGGCNFIFGDASVHFLQEAIDPDVFVSLFTRAGDDVVNGDF
jgi:hypothetical protein